MVRRDSLGFGFGWAGTTLGANLNQLHHSAILVRQNVAVLHE
jgi:hypothetical protein